MTRKYNYGLPGPNPPRNAYGGFKVTGLGAYGKARSLRFELPVKDRSCPESPCGHSFPPPATLVLRPEGCRCPHGEFAHGHDSSCPLFERRG